MFIINQRFKVMIGNSAFALDILSLSVFSCVFVFLAFPKYRYFCDPTYFLRNKKLDFIVCSIETEISAQGFNVIEDKLSQIKLVYR